MLTATERAALAAAQADGEAAKKGGWRAWMLFWSRKRRSRSASGPEAGHLSSAAKSIGDSQPDGKMANGAGRVTVVCAAADTEPPTPAQGGTDSTVN